MKIKREVFIALCVFFVLFGGYDVQAAVSAGVSPAYYELNFQPEQEESFIFNYRLGSSLDYNISVEGDLAQYVSVDKNTLHGSGSVTANLKLPKSIKEPGSHRIIIWANPMPSSGNQGGGVAVGAGIGGLILLHVPYPGQYAEINFDISNSNEGEKTPFFLEVFSRGNESVTTTSYIEVYDAEDISVEKFSVDSTTIPPISSKFIDSEIDTSDYVAGSYRAIAVTSFQGGEQRLEESFQIGELYVGISNYTSLLEKDKINRFDIEVQSFWNDYIEDVYAEVFIEGTDISFLTPSVDLPNWLKKNLQGYVDTSGIESDSIQAKIILHYAGETTEETVTLRLVKIDTGVNYLVIVIVVAVLLLLGFLAWIFLKLNKLEKKSGKKK